MQRRVFAQRYFSLPDLVILMLVATAIYGLVSIGREWRSDFHPVTEISLSVWALPYYTLLSAVRGLVAYTISLVFTLVVGYFAAHSAKAEKIIIPFLDILQSIPVLGFLPGLLLGLVALFPNTNTGLELAAIIMIFTGQVWNMTFSYYASLKSIPSDFKEASTVIGLSRLEKLRAIELPFSAVNLVWNSLLSMAGGWFFLIPCEAMTLGDKEYRLPGIGSYMFMAVKESNTPAIILAVVAMVLLILAMDFVIWRPTMAWVQKFRLEDLPGVAPAEPLMKVWFRESKVVFWARAQVRLLLTRLKRVRFHYRHRRRGQRPVQPRERANFPSPFAGLAKLEFGRLGDRLTLLVYLVVIGFVAFGAYKLLTVLTKIPPATWVQLLKDTFWTFCRVAISLVLSTLWAVPVGIWLSISPGRLRVAQPIIQVMASFPAPMLYPLALALFFAVGIPFDWGSMLLIFLGVQWYVLFNVLAGALRISPELNRALDLMEASHWDRWKTLYLPSVYPSLVTGWVTAAGGAWNASVVAEYIFYNGTILKTGGLGATLSVATANENFSLLAASLTLMVSVVIIINRVVWARLHRLA
ncbi:MAG: ABC transporter permease subunit, partial [Bdellovibrio sp.]|nr:ABC transporter permease subunit [Bdellovibrio sp.]